MTDAGDWLALFPDLAGLSPRDRADLLARSAVTALPAGTTLFGPGQAPRNYLLLLSGSIRVQQVAETGREIVLYRVVAGQSCALTTACLLSYEDYLAEGIAETDIRAVIVPRPVFDDLIARSAEFRRFVFRAFSTRVTDLCRIIEEVAFSRLDIRLAQKLLTLADTEGTVRATQQQMAAELGTAREVVNRLVAEFQRRGWIEAARGAIRIADGGALRVLAGGH
jgi:CRP/FNR family transcriptional regulator